ncbi:MAG: 30S ribosomal protein S12 methylthiotransferase RimO [Clostridia bacterium]|nr:30S ribosomal protein S12 methylthiotransferase RimO [Clostridia bacterium]
MMNKIGFVSLGCSKNLVDTENMIGIMVKEGYEVVADPQDAEIIVVNTCGFIDSAKEEAINTLLEMAEYKEGNCKMLVCAGCLAQRYSEDIKNELPEVDVILGTGSYKDIAVAIREAEEKGKSEYLDDINFEIGEEERVRTTPFYMGYIKIGEGCDNFCTYCAIPSIRGRYRSRKMESIVAEAERMAEEGVREIILVAQDTTRYGVDLYGEKKLPELLRRLCAIEKLKWVRVHYCYPEAIDDELIETFRAEEKIVKYLDIPVQHGCDSVLKRMGRKTTRAQILDRVKLLREKVEGITLRTSIIAGFPGETEEEFESLLSFVEEAKFDRMGVFAYSMEEGTPAAKLPNQVDEEVKEARRDAVMEKAKAISLKRNESMLGKVMEVVVEGFEDNLYFGRSGGESVDVDPKIYFGSLDELNEGDFIKVKIVNFDEYDLYGEQVEG